MINTERVKDPTIGCAEYRPEGRIRRRDGRLRVHVHQAADGPQGGQGDDERLQLEA